MKRSELRQLIREELDRSMVSEAKLPKPKFLTKDWYNKAFADYDAIEQAVGSEDSRGNWGHDPDVQRQFDLVADALNSLDTRWKKLLRMAAKVQ